MAKAISIIDHEVRATRRELIGTMADLMQRLGALEEQVVLLHLDADRLREDVDRLMRGGDADPR